MSPVEALQYLGASLGMCGMGLITLAPKKMLWSLSITAISCIAMGTYGYLTGQYGIAFSQTVYTVMNLLGLYQWKKVKIK